MAALGAPGTHPEGWFLPETYLFPRGTRDIDILSRAHRAMRELLDRLWPERDPRLPLTEPYQALILASIVEKEAKLPEERPRIAGVLVRRLALGMRLQADPTVVYGLGPDFSGRLRRADLERDTDYNTYLRPGLPPTPIALPGRAAIEAALRPEDGDALYFVARGDGSHHFRRRLRNITAPFAAISSAPRVPPAKSSVGERWLAGEHRGGGGRKSTVLAAAEAFLRGRGEQVVSVREPGGTALGERLRTLLLEPGSEPIAPAAELLLIFASRAQLIAERIRGALERGAVVLCDRFTDASFAYQGAGRGLDLAWIAELERRVVGFKPALTILLDLPVADAQRRLGERPRDRIEREDATFFERVRTAYLERARREPARFRVINAAQPPGVVAAAVQEALDALLRRHR